MTASLPDLPGIRFTGLVYRALNPIWHREPMSGEGARRHGGRFNLKGQAALYTSCHVQTALAEAGQLGRPLQPMTLVSYAADIAAVFDATDPTATAKAGFAADELTASDWRLQMLSTGASSGQRIADRLIADGFRALLVPSFARSTSPGGRNLVMWDWRGSLTVHNDEGRLNPQS